MPKTHIHPYETQFHAHATYSKTIRASGDLVFMQGQVGLDLDGTLIGPGDAGAQADQACRNIAHWMGEAGRSLKDVCKLTLYVTNIDHRPAVYAAVNRWFDGVQHCSTGVTVSGLADPAFLVEIDAMAVIG